MNNNSKSCDEYHKPNHIVGFLNYLIDNKQKNKKEGIVGRRYTKEIKDLFYPWHTLSSRFSCGDVEGLMVKCSFCGCNASYKVFMGELSFNICYWCVEKLKKTNKDLKKLNRTMKLFKKIDSFIKKLKKVLPNEEYEYVNCASRDFDGLLPPGVDEYCLIIKNIPINELSIVHQKIDEIIIIPCIESDIDAPVILVLQKGKKE